MIDFDMGGSGVAYGLVLSWSISAPVFNGGIFSILLVVIHYYLF
jgi:hypothetical protein